MLRAAATRLLVCLGLVALLSAQEPPELVIPAGGATLDASLAEWPEKPAIQLGDKAQLLGEKTGWVDPADLSAGLHLRADSSHLYVAGWVVDDQFVYEPERVERSDRIELYLDFGAGDGALPLSPLVLQPLQARSFGWLEQPGATSAQTASQLAGIRVVGKRVGASRYEFEAAIPFHHFVGLQPGARRCRVNVVLRDFDAGDQEAPTSMSWTGHDPAELKGLAAASLPEPGPLVAKPIERALWSQELFADLPYLLVPLATLAGLVFLLRGWASVRGRARWLRPVLVGAGLLAFVIGLALPAILSHWRANTQREQLATAQARLQEELGKMAVLASYRGPSRDHALMELLAGRPIARQRYTTYRSLAQLAPGQFGPPLRDFGDLPVRDYWLPLAASRPERFQFDPPARGSLLHVVVGRPFVPPFSFVSRPNGPPPRVDLELDHGDGDVRRVSLDLSRPFSDCPSLGRDGHEAIATPVPLARDLRAVTVLAVQGVDLHLVGMSLEVQAGTVEPLWLGEPTRQGVLTDLRGPYPLDAGLELAPGATTKVTVPRLPDQPARVVFVYRAIYPRFATAIPGARVGEIVLHFSDGTKRSLVLEHQVSVFYELAVHNTRDDLPEGSPAAIALSWVDDKQERHVNLAYPVRDLPRGAALEAIEFRNQAGYWMQFRSVVFVNEGSAAPQDPADSPLQRVNDKEFALKPAARERLGNGLVAIYRGGRLSESNHRGDGPGVPATLPPPTDGSGVHVHEELLGDGSRRAMRFAPLGGDGWDGAVLAVGEVDRDWEFAALFANRLGLGLCLLSAPFLLVLFSELLAAATNLRLRLMAVTMVASLAPLGLLSLVLVQVLEGGHDAEVAQGLRTAVRSATAQLDDQKTKVRSSAQQWLAGLSGAITGRTKGLDETQFVAAVPGIAAELQKLLGSQLPPDWRGGFLRLDWVPRLGKAAAAPVALFAGDRPRAGGELQARLEPGVFVQWGVMLLGVRAEQAVGDGRLVLTAARPLDADMLGTLAPGLDVLLTDVRGYPIAGNGARPEAASMLQRASEPARMAQREQALLRGLEAREPVVERGRAGDEGTIFGSDVLRDLLGTPRALLCISRPAQRATLDLAVGRIPVRAFFLLVAGSLVVLAVFLSYVVSSRISRPIERLELGAQALSRGQLDTRVPVDDGGQIGRLTRAFNQMATDLQGRLLDLQALNRTMADLAAGEDERGTLDVLLRFCQAQTPADEVRVVLVEGRHARLLVHAGNSAEVQDLPADTLPMAAIRGAFSVVGTGGRPPAGWQVVVPNARSLVALPIVYGGQVRGVVVLGFGRVPPLPVDLGLLSTVVAQAALALERGLLQRLAVQDPVTSAFTPEYFRRRLVDEVSLAQQRNQTLVLVALALGDGDRRPRGLRRFAEVLRSALPATAVVSHAGAGLFHAALPVASPTDAQELVRTVQGAWTDLVQRSRDAEVLPGLHAAVASFPEEAASAEFLFDVVRARLAAARTAAEAAAESDEALVRAGVTSISPAMREVYLALRRIAPTDLPLLLEGETGVGKEVLTNLVHRWSRRAGGPLVKVHCAALSESLLVPELFGHEKGAFTGAERRKLGRFEMADGGTLFLDEVGEISLDAQVKLLRVLQEGEFERVGGTAPVRVDVRVIAATNRDIAQMVASGTFREDLYYRLQGMVVHVPPLRERKPELAPLVEQFRAELGTSGAAPSLPWSTDALDELYRQEWPGNIRQLRNTVFRAMVLANGGLVQRRDVVAALAVGTPAAMVSGGVAGVEAAPVPVPLPSEVARAVVQSVGPESAGPAIEPPAAEPVVVMPSPPAPGHRSGLVPSDCASPVDEVASAGGPEGPAGEAQMPATDLPARLRELLRAVVQAGSYSTQQHMAAHGLSHRTALRDLQTLLAAGLVERVGSRRGAFYRPSSAADRFLGTPDRV